MRQAEKLNLDQLVLRAFYWIDESFQRNLQERGGPKVTHAQSMVIMTIGEGIQRPSQIAERLGVTRQAVHQCLHELIRINLVELVVDPNDKRAKIARLSSKGEPVRKMASQVFAELEAELATRIGKRNIQQFRTVLEQDWGPLPSLKV